MSDPSFPPAKYWKGYLFGALLGLVLGTLIGGTFFYERGEESCTKSFGIERQNLERDTQDLRQEAIDRGFAELVLVPNQKGGGRVDFVWKGENKRCSGKPTQEAPKQQEAKPPPPEKIIDLPDKSKTGGQS